MPTMITRAHRKIEKSYDGNNSDTVKNPIKHGLLMNNKTKNQKKSALNNISYEYWHCKTSSKDESVTNY